jgi:putative tricarboxylic transport membrane protein
MNEAIRLAFEQVFLLKTLGIIALAASYGIFVGSIPGLTATMAVALIVPLTFFLTDVQAIAAIVTTVTCSIFAGDIPAALVRIPGTPASAAYANDAYALTRRGKPGTALGISLVFSVLGGLFGTIVLALAAPQLARLAANFTSYEYFWLYVLGLTCAAIVSDDSRLKGAFALLLGLLFSTVGLGTDYSVPRMTFGFDQLIMGINFIPAMIGLFGISEVLRNALASPATLGGSSAPSAGESPEEAVDTMHVPIRQVMAEVLPLAARRPLPLMRSSVIGAIMGMLPGAGADIAAWISYAISKRFSKNPDEYGKGTLEGMADATGANNAALGSAWIPALVFGVPGDSVTAIAIGVLLMKDIHPGPDIFDATRNPQQAALVYSIYVTFVLANLMLIPLGLLAIRTGSMLIRIPRSVMLPMIVVFCVVGSYALNADYFDVVVMLAMGVLGYVLEGFRVPLGPVVLGIILGGHLEHKFIQSLMKSEGPAGFLQSPISITLAVGTLLLWIVPLLVRKKVRS